VAGAAIALVIYTSNTQSAILPAPSTKPGIIRHILSSISRVLFNPQVWVIALLMVGPTALYYLSKGGRASEYFTNWTLALSHLLVEPTFYMRWLRLIQSLVGWWALILSAAGTLLSAPRNRALLAGLWGGYLGYGLFLPSQMYSHSYYHLQLVPIVALSMLSPVQLLVQKVLEPKIPLNISRLVRFSTWKPLWAGLALLLLAFSSWQALIPLYSQDYRNEPAYWQEIASYLPTSGKIMALTQDYGYRLMYFGWRKVILWPNRGEQQLSQLRGSDKEFLSFFDKHTDNMSYFLITAFRQFDDQPDLKQYLNDHYPIHAQGQGYIIFDLTKPK